MYPLPVACLLSAVPMTGLSLPARKPGASDPTDGSVPPPAKKKSRRGGDASMQKRRCVSTACVACRRRKSKCDGALPKCAACASVYGTECTYDPGSDHRRKGVYREKIDSMKASNSTLQIIVEAILNAEEDDVGDLVKRIRTCDSLDAVAESILKQDFETTSAQDSDGLEDDYTTDIPLEGERDLARKMGELRLENGTIRFIGGTSHLIHWDVLGSPDVGQQDVDMDAIDANPITSWSNVTKDPEAITHLLNMYFTWHYPYFTSLTRSLFYRDFFRGRGRVSASRSTAYCSSLLVNAMLALGCHFTNVTSAYGTMGDSWSKGDHFFAEAKRLVLDEHEYENPRITTVQALALMSVREAGCGREAKGWVYSGMSFRMAQDIGLNMDLGGIQGDHGILDDAEVDARRVTFWGCFLFDKCWSNYLGRLPQLHKNSYNVPKYDVFPDEEAESWCPYTDSGFDEVSKQAARTRTIGLQMLKLCEISSDLLLFFYHPTHISRPMGKSVELKKLSELHRRLEEWHKELPAELEPKDGQLPNAILMHMFFHLQYIHLFRPFLRYKPSASPLPPHVSPRRICTAHASAISKLMRLYKKTYNLRQICNIAVYMLHSACTIHLLNLPEKTARRDITHGVKHLEELAEDWICGRRTLSIISVLSRKWSIDLPDEAAQILQRTDEQWGIFNTSDVPSPRSPGLRIGSPSPTSQSTTDPSPPEDSRSSISSWSSNVEAVPRPDFNPQEHKVKQVVDNISLMGQSIPLDLQALNTPNWSSSATNGPIPSYAQSFIPLSCSVSCSGQPPQSVAGQSRTQSHPPNPMFGIDGQDWYLNDGVNWQAGFDAWNMANVTTQAPNNVPEQQVFVFGATIPPAPVTTTTQSPSALALDFNFDSLSSMDGWDLANSD
ncbi:fungal-specific transcription factor domain-containing protein [Xylariaceae sp. FL1272]|nr:fungal-specific transcription factor domain-containing protein [Xylariaceae sp. FL1272]